MAKFRYFGFFKESLCPKQLKNGTTKIYHKIDQTRLIELIFYNGIFYVLHVNIFYYMIKFSIK